MENVAFISDVASLPRFLRVRELFALLTNIHPNFSQEKARGFLEGTDVRMDARIKNLSKGMIAQLHLAVVMAIDAKLLVLDEPTLGLDITYRKRFYRRLLEDYMTEERTLADHHPPGGRDRVHALRHHVHPRWRADPPHADGDGLDQVSPRSSSTRRTSPRPQALGPIYAETRFGQTAMVFDGVDRDAARRRSASVSTPTLSDLFVALMQRGDEMKSPHCPHQARVSRAPRRLLLCAGASSSRSSPSSGDPARLAPLRRFGPGGVVRPRAQGASSSASLPTRACGSSTCSVALFFYFADAFSADRRNNSMLFWKSMPVSRFQDAGLQDAGRPDHLPGAHLRRADALGRRRFDRPCIIAVPPCPCRADARFRRRSSPAPARSLVFDLVLPGAGAALVRAVLRLGRRCSRRCSAAGRIPLAFLIPGLVGLAENLLLRDGIAPARRLSCSATCATASTSRSIATAYGPRRSSDAPFDAGRA